MSDETKDALGFAFAFLAITAGIVIGVWFAGQVIGAVGSWWSSVTYVSPEERAKRDAEHRQADEEWAKDPRNPKVTGQACLDAGGIPDYSAWDGDVKACNKPGGGNIEVKQSVEVKQ